MRDCIFCAITGGRAPASRVYEDERCLAFLDIQPVNPGHLLIIPKRHADGLDDLEAEDGAHMFRVAQRLSAAVRQSGVECEGVDLFLADGEVAGQEVFHVHLHIIPRFDGDGFGFLFPAGYREVLPTRVELDRIAAGIRLQV